MSPSIIDGWLVVPYSGPELVPVYVVVGGERFPAFLDRVDGVRIAKIPRPSGMRGVKPVAVQHGSTTAHVGHVRL